MTDGPSPSAISGGDFPTSEANTEDISPTATDTVDEADKLLTVKQKDESRFRYGNYNRYYGTRVGGLDHDPRLDVLDADWFRNAAVLDIGCNVGALTLSIARAYAPRRVLGIDIDAHLIGVARKNIRHYCDAGEEMAGKFPAALVKARKADDVKVRKFPHNVWFQCENYVLADDYLLEMVRPEFDAILALSITKWIHLNWGDDGMRRFFRRAFRQLRPGGRLIVEPQAFATYSRRRKMADEMAENYRSIQFKPDQFTDYLLSDEVGFESVEKLAVPAAKTKGFERPIFVYRKAVVRKADEWDGEGECQPSARKRKRPSRRSKQKPADANKEVDDNDDAEPRI